MVVISHIPLIAGYIVIPLQIYIWRFIMALYPTNKQRRPFNYKRFRLNILYNN